MPFKIQQTRKNGIEHYIYSNSTNTLEIKSSYKKVLKYALKSTTTNYLFGKNGKLKQTKTIKHYADLPPEHANLFNKCEYIYEEDNEVLRIPMGIKGYNIYKSDIIKNYVEQLEIIFYPITNIKSDLSYGYCPKSVECFKSTDGIDWSPTWIHLLSKDQR